MHRQRSLERMGTDFQREPTIIFNSRNVKVGDLLKLRNQANKTESSPTKTREFFSNKKLYDSIEITNEQLYLSGDNENFLNSYETRIHKDLMLNMNNTEEPPRYKTNLSP